MIGEQAENLLQPCMRPPADSAGLLCCPAEDEQVRAAALAALQALPQGRSTVFFEESPVQTEGTPLLSCTTLPCMHHNKYGVLHALVLLQVVLRRLHMDLRQPQLLAL